MELKDEIKVTDKMGFVYTVTVKHWPVTGISIAYHDDRRIAQREYGRMLPPTSDNDREWEQWQERFREWADASISDLILDCVSHFNRALAEKI
jgi:hypothetical protein